MHNTVKTTTPLSGTLAELQQLYYWLQEGKKIALAQVVSTWGSSPRPVGSLLVVNEYGDFLGSISGGCIEGAVIAECQEIIQSGETRKLEFGVSQEKAWEVGLSCGGSISIFIQPITSLILLKQLITAWQNKQPVALLTDLLNGNQKLVSTEASHNEASIDKQIQIDSIQLLKVGKSAPLNSKNKPYFVRSFIQPYRLFVIGAVHIAQALVPMAVIAGFEITIIDPRAAFATEIRFDGVQIYNEWPDEILAQSSLDKYTAIVTLTHDPKIDDPALVCALNSPAFYIGSLGSKRTHAQRIERLSDDFDHQTLKRIKAPLGLNLGGRLPAEIAVAILGQIIQDRYLSIPL